MYGAINLSYLIKDDIVNVPNGKRVKYLSEGLEAYMKRISDFPKLLRSNPVHVTDDMIELYLEVSSFIIQQLTELHLSPSFPCHYKHMHGLSDII